MFFYDALLVLGDNLERAVGKWKYLIIYIGSGLGASMTSVLFNWITGQMNVVAAGASGAARILIAIKIVFMKEIYFHVFL